MSNDPVLLFLHGVGSSDPEDIWKTDLTGALEKLGYPNLDDVQVIAPKYAHALKGWDYKVSLPDETVRAPVREAAKQNRRDFERRMGAVEFRLGRQNHGAGLQAYDAILSAAVALPWFAAAHNYLNDPQIRAQVLSHIISLLPSSGRLVLVGHSLGSLIAADLLTRLPIGLEVAGMVTVGSPLANGKFDVDKLRETLKHPPINLSWWVNFWNVLDPVAAHRGVSSVFPWMVDFRVRTKATSPVQAHSASEYLANETVAAAIGFAIFGSQSKELVGINEGRSVDLDDPERLALLALRYGHLVKSELKGELRDRFTGALRHVQATAVDDIRNRNDQEGRAMPSEVARLAFDLSDPDSRLPEPTPTDHFSKETAVMPLTVLATDNFLRPFEIEISKTNRREAMRELSAEMGVGGKFGIDVIDAAQEAQNVLSGQRGAPWIKWGIVGAGVAVLAVATSGLIFAAAPGLAGAAAITSALASFGPGGMIGGLVTAGSLVTVGGGGIAFGLASSGTSAETLEAFVAQRLTAVILRKRQGLEPDPDVWRILSETEIQVRREHERLDEFSDESSPALKELKRKINAVERALKYLRENGLEPQVLPTDLVRQD